MREVYEDKIDYSKMINAVLMSVYQISNIPFVIIIDEWDCVIRNSDNEEIVHKYLQFLHSLFKSEESKSFLALAYITGILPIKKIKDESALNNFREYTMLDSYPITEYYGFNEEEVEALCRENDMDFESTKAWYNGYLIDGKHMYNPNSVAIAMDRHRFDSYWKNTSSFASINTFITMNYAGLKDDIMTMLAGGMVMVETDAFQNDLSEIHSKDDALTALIHLGYLAYDAERKSAHDTYTSVLKYNDENSLSGVLTMAYFTAPAYYNIVREMPSGKGFADFVFIPRANAGKRPAMVVELKYNKSADTAIKQIKEKRYQGVLVGYSDKILLVGINYDAEGNDKKHTCVIEEWG